MMEFYVSGQSLKMFTPVTAADSLKYLTAQFHFTDDDWDGYTRWAHFRRGETVYDIELDGEDCITEEDALNLTTGEWEIGEAVKISPADNKYIPVICGTAGALLGVAAMYTVPEFPAGDIINAIAVGIVSGLSATGADQIAKQMKK